MIVLAIDTSTDLAGVGLFDTEANRTLYALAWTARRQQTRDLAVRLQTAFQACHIAPSGLGMIAVATGPGSFTGVRIGISVAKGMALGLQPRIPLVGIPTMSVILWPMYRQAQILAPEARLIGVLPAGRDNHIWTGMSAQAPWCFGAGDIHHLGTCQEFGSFLQADVQPAAGRCTWVGGEMSPELLTLVTDLPRSVALESREGAWTVAVLARLARLRWQQDPDCTAVRNLAPIYVSSL